MKQKSDNAQDPVNYLLLQVYLKQNFAILISHLQCVCKNYSRKLQNLEVNVALYVADITTWIG